MLSLVAILFRKMANLNVVCCSLVATPQQFSPWFQNFVIIMILIITTIFVFQQSYNNIFQMGPFGEVSISYTPNTPYNLVHSRYYCILFLGFQKHDFYMKNNKQTVVLNQNLMVLGKIYSQVKNRV